MPKASTFATKPIHLSGGGEAPPSGRIEIVEAATAPSSPKPTEADVLRALADLSRKAHQLSRNQQIIEGKLDHITKRVAALDTNLVVGVQYLTKVMNSIGWWAAGDKNTAEQTWPSSPHWR